MPPKEMVNFKLKEPWFSQFIDKVYANSKWGNKSRVLRDLVINHYLSDCQEVDFGLVKGKLEEKLEKKLTDGEKALVKESIKAIGALRGIKVVETKGGMR